MYDIVKILENEVLHIISKSLDGRKGCIPNGIPVGRAYWVSGTRQGPWKAMNNWKRSTSRYTSVSYFPWILNGWNCPDKVCPSATVCACWINVVRLNYWAQARDSVRWLSFVGPLWRNDISWHPKCLSVPVPLLLMPHSLDLGCIEQFYFYKRHERS